MAGPNYAKYLKIKAERVAAEEWLAHIGKSGRENDTLGLSTSHASIKLTVCGQYTTGGQNYRENPPEFGVALLTVIHADFADLAAKAITRMKANERQALAAAEVEINAINALLAEALGNASAA